MRNINCENVSVVCGPGTHSRDGRPPCSPCAVGSYQPDYGRIGCRRCGRGVTTDSDGATSFQQCRVTGQRWRIQRVPELGAWIGSITDWIWIVTPIFFLRVSRHFDIDRLQLTIVNPVFVIITTRYL